MSKLDVVIVDYMAEDLVNRCLQSISEHPAVRHEFGHVIVIDNAGDDKVRVYEAPGIPLIVQKSPENLGFAGGCNLGASLGQAEYILFLNPDTMALENTFDGAIDALIAHPEAAGLGVQLVDEEGEVQQSCHNFPTPREYWLHAFGLLAKFGPAKKAGPMALDDHLRPGYVDLPMGAFLLVRRAQFDAIGGFDELFFVYFDEVDLCYRMRQEFGPMFFVPDVQAMHSGRGTTDTIKARRHFYTVRSRLYFTFKHFPFPKLASTLFVSLFVEPFARIGFLLLRRRKDEIPFVIEAYRMLWGARAEIKREFRTYRQKRNNWRSTLRASDVVKRYASRDLSLAEKRP